MFYDILFITFLFLLFAASHTFLASQKTKKKLVEKLGDKIAFYRLFYNISSIITLLFIYTISPKPSAIIYDLQFPLDLVIFVLQIFSAFGLIWGISKVNLREFLGISQIERYIDNRYNADELDEKLELVIEGPFRFSRHPIYLFTILFLALRPTMDLFYLVFLLNIVLYFYVGSYFEERKLLEIFGHRYQEYQNSVSRLFPTRIFKNKK